MKKNDFIEKLIYLGILIIDKPDYDHDVHRMSEDIKGLLRLTSFIDFGCRFDEDGRCNGQSKTLFKNDKKCCCNECSYYAGYLKLIRDIDINYYANKFNRKTGFWREGRGHILDVEMRSPTCVCYVCQPIQENTTLKNDLDILEVVIKKIQKDISEHIYNEQQKKKELER